MTRDEMRLRLIASVAPHFIAERQGMEFVAERHRTEWAADRCVDFADAVLESMQSRDMQTTSDLYAAVDRLKATQARLDAENGGSQ